MSSSEKSKCPKCGWEDAPKTHIDTCNSIQIELPLPKHGTAYPKGVEWNLTAEFNQFLQQMIKPKTVGEERLLEDGATVVWECLGCGKQGRRITELLGRRIVNAKLTPK